MWSPPSLWSPLAGNATETEQARKGFRREEKEKEDGKRRRKGSWEFARREEAATVEEEAEPRGSDDRD